MKSLELRLRDGRAGRVSQAEGRASAEASREHGLPRHLARALGRKKDEAGRLLVPGWGAQFSRVWASPRGSWRALQGLALCSRELLWETANELGDRRTQQQGLCLMRLDEAQGRGKRLSASRLG